MRATHEPQPYAAVNIDQALFNIRSTRQKRHVSTVAFDRAHGLLYVLEYRADGDKPLVHVWHVQT
ncbi:MAG: hypothetical protein JXQ73_18235 [Phycisphaerae bacterium]|nr:hypothetical protein [Phycisphaerae bacterium]